MHGELPPCALEGLPEPSERHFQVFLVDLSIDPLSPEGPGRPPVGSEGPGRPLEDPLFKHQKCINTEH